MTNSGIIIDLKYYILLKISSITLRFSQLYTNMLSKFFTLLCAILLSSLLFGQSTAKTPPAIKYRLLLTSVELQDVSQDEIVITLNAFNTGRNPIDLYQFNSVPAEMEVKFEESFYRSNLSEMDDDIIASLLNRNITIANGKILRNLKFNLQANEQLYKELTKSQKKFSRSYSASDKKKAPKLKYKTNTKKAKGSATDLFARNKNKKSSTKDIVTESKQAKSASTDKTVLAPTAPEVSKDVSNVEPKKSSGGSASVESSILPKVKTIKNPKIEKEKKIGVLAKQKEKKIENERFKKESYEIEKASQKEDEKVILESLGVGESNATEVAFDTRAGVEASKNSYEAKSVCPDLVFKGMKIVKKTKNYITIEYTLENLGKGPAYLGNNSKSTNIAIRAFLSTSENISRGSLPLGGGFVTYNNGKSDQLNVAESFTASIKLDIKKMTRFTPYIILNFDPFNAMEECSKANNYSSLKIDN